MPKLSKELSVVLPGDVYPTVFQPGDEVTGDVAQIADAAGCLSKAGRPAKKAMSAPENK